MKKNAFFGNKWLRDTLISIAVFAVSVGISFFLENVFSVGEHVTTFFVFAVFVVSVLTDGFIYGIAMAAAGVVFINYAFTFPYFDIDFSATEAVLSALVMILISLPTSALTTQLKKWRSLREEGEREMMRANLLRAVSHDLRTPLTTIYGSSSAIIDSYDVLSDGQKQKMVRGIKEDSEWLIRIVENLLSVTRIDNGKAKLIKSPTVLEELMDSVILKFRKRYPAQDVTIDIPDDIVVIPMDALLIEQVLINMLENAVQHAKGMTRLMLRAFVIGERAIFEVIDDGCGIERTRLDKIFAGYVTAGEQPAEADKRNAGIGLSVCATIIKAHGGSISAENGKGGGAIFRFSLETSADSRPERSKYDAEQI